LNDENLLIINKTKHPIKGEKMAQDGRTHVLANKESSNDHDETRTNQIFKLLKHNKHIK
jgi:hypothetical protein